jgi:hypothetical protein
MTAATAGGGRMAIGTRLAPTAAAAVRRNRRREIDGAGIGSGDTGSHISDLLGFLTGGLGATIVRTEHRAIGRPRSARVHTEGSDPRQGRIFDDIEPARSWLAEHNRCTGRTGASVSALGGGYALLLAPAHGYSASSVNHGGCPKDAASFLADRIPPRRGPRHINVKVRELAENIVARSEAQPGADQSSPSGPADR